jgi:phosphoserine/homoserine phosphotransferase
MLMACLDLEGVLVPEIWIGFSEKTGIEELRLTTRDVPDYDALMRRRLGILREHGLGLHDIQRVIGTLRPLPGAAEFLAGLREDFQVAILSDTFYEFAAPLMRQLGYPLLLCNRLIVDDEGRISDFRIRQADPKRCAVRAFHDLSYRVVAAGDSYNDTSMLAEADAGILFRPPDNVIAEFPQFSVTREYDALRSEFDAARAHLEDLHD